MVYPRTKVLERRREVTTLLVRGVPPGEIAEMLGVPRETVYNDIRAVRSGRNPALAAHSRREIVAQLYLNVQARIRRLWHLADTANSEHVQVRALHELRLNDQYITNKLPPVPAPEEMAEEEAREKERRERHGKLEDLTRKLFADIYAGTGTSVEKDGSTMPEGMVKGALAPGGSAKRADRGPNLTNCERNRRRLRDLLGVPEDFQRPADDANREDAHEGPEPEIFDIPDQAAE